MPRIHNPTLTVAVDDDLTHATVRVRCNVQFTDFEVNTMNKLGLVFTLSCRVINKDLWYEATSLVMDDVTLPRIPGGATPSEEVVFDTVTTADALREHMFTRDELFAELTLVNYETGAEEVARSEPRKVDLAA